MENYNSVLVFGFLLIIILLFSYQIYLQRKHNIRSVKPIIHVGQWDYENNLMVTLQNVGAGLALVKKLSISNGEETKPNLYEWLPRKLGKGVNYKEYWTPYNDFVIQPNQVIKLIEIPFDTTFIDQVKIREEVRVIIGKLTVIVEYLDLYDNLMPIKELKLIHFLRNDNVNLEIN